MGGVRLRRLTYCFYNHVELSLQIISNGDYIYHVGVCCAIMSILPQFFKMDSSLNYLHKMQDGSKTSCLNYFITRKSPTAIRIRGREKSNKSISSSLDSMLVIHRGSWNPRDLRGASGVTHFLGSP